MTQQNKHDPFPHFYSSIKAECISHWAHEQYEERRQALKNDKHTTGWLNKIRRAKILGEMGVYRKFADAHVVVAGVELPNAPVELQSIRVTKENKS